MRRLDVEDRGDPKPFRSVSCRRVSWGVAAAAAASGSSAGSPSKKRAIEIYALSARGNEVGSSVSILLPVNSTDTAAIKV